MNNRHLIFLLAIIIFIATVNVPIETFENMKHYDCIISINVHEKFNFLLKQLKNIQENVSCNYAIILNCNEYMFNECKNNTLPENVYIHDKSLEKKRFHGSLTEGIYNNMNYALQYFTFDYFIIVSSRNLFENNLKLEDLNKMVASDTIGLNDMKEQESKSWKEDKEWGGWHSLPNTLLAKYYLSKNENLYHSAIEGIVFTANCCKKIIDFLENNQEIKFDLFNFEAQVEEFALQTIAANIGEKFYNIGNGCYTSYPIGTNSPNGEVFKFSYKVNRDDFRNRSFITCNSNRF